jgi:hypothetical protein
MLFTRRVSKIPLARTITTKTTRPETATISQRLKIVEFLTLSVLFVAPAPAVSSLVGFLIETCKQGEQLLAPRLELRTYGALIDEEA